jgi:OOP family OmpA-OmpF porin
MVFLIIWISAHSFGPSSTNDAQWSNPEQRNWITQKKQSMTVMYLLCIWIKYSTSDYSSSVAGYVANFMKRNPGVNVEIKGYVDES